MKFIQTFNDVVKIIGELESRLSRLDSTNIDMKGRRIVNASDSMYSDHYVTRRELDELRKDIEEIKTFVGMP